MVEQLVRQINATKYLECSRNDVNGIEKIFEEAVWASLRRVEEKFHKPKVPTTRKFRFCGLTFLTSRASICFNDITEILQRIEKFRVQ